MKFKFCILVFFAACVSVFGAAQSVDMDRLSRTAVGVGFIFETEHGSMRQTAVASVLDEGGLAVLEPNAIPEFVRPKNIKDLKVFYRGGDDDGIPAEFLGFDPIYGFNFIKIKAPLPAGIVPLSSIKRAKAALGARVFGFERSSIETNMHISYMESYVMSIIEGDAPRFLSRAGLCELGSAAFDADGALVGIGVGGFGEDCEICASSSDNFRAYIVSTSARLFVDADAVYKIAGRFVKDPNLEKTGWIGIGNLSVVKKSAAKMMGVENSAAISAGDVIKNSPADRAGLKAGAIFVSVNGKPLASYDYPQETLLNFTSAVATTPPGGKIVFEVLDGGAKKTVSADVAKHPKRLNQTESKYFKKLGFSIREFIMDDAFKHRILDADAQGAVVEFVEPNGPADGGDSALASGHLLVEINSSPVRTYAQAVRMLEAAQKSSAEITLLVSEINQTKLVRIKAEK